MFYVHNNNNSIPPKVMVHGRVVSSNTSYTVSGLSWFFSVLRANSEIVAYIGLLSRTTTGLSSRIHESSYCPALYSLSYWQRINMRSIPCRLKLSGTSKQWECLESDWPGIQREICPPVQKTFPHIITTAFRLGGVWQLLFTFYTEFAQCPTRLRGDEDAWN